MIRIALAGLALATLSAAAQARPDYDSSIDAAAARIVAAKIGELRGSFDYRTPPRMTPAVDRASTGSLRRQPGDGLRPAADLRYCVQVFR
jgi:hypothetical protein